MSDVFKEWTTGVVVNLFDYQCPFCGKLMRRSDAVAVGGWRNVLVHPSCKAMIEDTKNVGALEEMRSRCANSSWEGDDLGGPHCPPETLKVVVRDDYAGGHHDFILFDKFGYVPRRQTDHTGNRFLPFTDHHNELHINYTYELYELYIQVIQITHSNSCFSRSFSFVLMLFSFVLVRYSCLTRKSLVMAVWGFGLKKSGKALFCSLAVWMRRPWKQPCCALLLAAMTAVGYIGELWP